MKKRLPVGISDFEEMITKNYYFVDKSLMIKEVIASGAKVTLIPRPRRFGKTLNLSMLKFFFEKTSKSNRYLFDNLAISKESECMKEQGKYPVIFLTFKDARDSSWKNCYEAMTQTISGAFADHGYLLDSEALTECEKNEIKKIIQLEADLSLYKNSLKKLISYLHRYHKKRPIILVDEYTTPVRYGFRNKYYDFVINFMQDFFGTGFKDSSNFKFAVVVGILPIEYKVIFSNIENLDICSILNEKYKDKFGFLESEVKKIQTDFNIGEVETRFINDHFNGYNVGSISLFDPLPVGIIAKNNTIVSDTMFASGDNIFVANFIKQGSSGIKQDLEALLLNKTITKPIHENLVLTKIESDDDMFWNFLLFSGYLTFKNLKIKNKSVYGDLCFPNLEMKYFFMRAISFWFDDYRFKEVLKYLICCDIKVFSLLFKNFVIKSFSYFDVTGNEPEKFYHAFVLGLLVDLSKTHHVKSNRESGYGRYDVMIIPKDKTKPGIIIEFKKIDKEDEKDLEQSAQKALEQIEEKQYEIELKDLGVGKVVKLAIVFNGKSVLIKEAN